MSQTIDELKARYEQLRQETKVAHDAYAKAVVDAFHLKAGDIIQSGRGGAEAKVVGVFARENFRGELAPAIRYKKRTKKGWHSNTQTEWFHLDNIIKIGHEADPN